MKYHGYIIKKCCDPATYGIRTVYEIYKNQKLVAAMLTLNKAKEFINSEENHNVLW